MKTKEVILVDDDPINNFIMKKMLTFESDIVLKIFEFPEKALAYVKENKDHCEFLILLDINMFIIDGWEFLDELDKNSFGSKVIVITSSDNIEDRQRATSNKRVIKFFVKPLTDEEIVILKKLIEKSNV